MSAGRRLLMVGLDAADGDLVLRWIEEGRLPVLGALAERGVVLPLRSEGEHMPESSWAPLVSGCGPEQAEIDIAARAAWDPGGAIRA